MLHRPTKYLHILVKTKQTYTEIEKKKGTGVNMNPLAA